MSRYAADSRDRVYDAVDMLALVESRVELRRAAVDSYFGLCPFHDERTGSFHVRPDEKHYHCFGCQASGDPFTFVMETEGVDFKAALESLAQRFNVTLETEDEDPAAASRRQRRERLYTLLGRRDRLLRALPLGVDGGRGGARVPARPRAHGGDAARVQSRIRAERVGPAAARLAQRPGSAMPSCSTPASSSARAPGRDRSTTASASGSCFRPSTRAVGSAGSAPARCATTSPRSTSIRPTALVYHKRSQLFGIDLARAAAARAGRMILVEGYTDVLALHQAGLGNAVGIMGTSLTEEQVGELERVVRVLELCLDADRAGQDAMLRAAKLAEGRNRRSSCGWSRCPTAPTPPT